MRLKRELKRTTRALNALQSRLKLEGVPEEEAAVQIVAGIREVERVESEIGLIRTGYLVMKAIRMGIDLPPMDWYYTRYITHLNYTKQVSTLTQYGESKLRRSIRAERERLADFWLKHIPALTGLLGTLIGVIAILTN